MATWCCCSFYQFVIANNEGVNYNYYDYGDVDFSVNKITLQLLS